MTENAALDFGTAVGMETEDYLTYDGPGGGGSGSKIFLEPWKDKDAQASIDVWLHPKSKVFRWFGHSWNREYESRDGKKVGLYRFNSMESEVKDNKGVPRWDKNWLSEEGLFEHPSELCPFGRTLNWVAEQIYDDKLDLIDEIFRFGGDTKDARKVYAGGFVGLFDKLKEKEDIERVFQKTGYTKKNNYKYNALAKIQFLFVVIADRKLEDGPRVTIEGQGLYRAFRKCVQDVQVQAASTAEREGQRQNLPKDQIAKRVNEAMVKADPRNTPFCMQWQNDPKAKTSSDFYRAVPMLDYTVTDALKEMFEEEPLKAEVAKLVGKPNVAELRANFEKHWVGKIPLPLDHLFGPAYKALAGTAYVEMPTDFNHGANDTAEDSSPSAASAPLERPPVEPAKSESAAQPSGRRSPAKAAPSGIPPEPFVERDDGSCYDNAGNEVVLCEACEKPMYAVALQCPHADCKREYEVVDGKYILKPERKSEPEPAASPTIRRPRRRGETA